MAVSTPPAVKPPFRKVLLRRSLIALAAMVLILVPSVVLFMITKQPSATYASMGAMIGMFALIAGNRHLAVITAIVVALLAPISIVAGLSPVTGAALMALMTLVVGRMSLFGLQRAVMLVPIFLAWTMLEPMPWITSADFTRINEVLSKSGGSMAQALNTVQSGSASSSSGSVPAEVTNALIHLRFDSTYLAWVAVFFFVGAIVPVIVLPFALRKVHMPKPVPHPRSEALPYTIAIAIITSAGTFYFLDRPKVVGGAFLIATVLVLVQVGNDMEWKMAIDRVLGTFGGMAVLLGLVAVVGRASYTVVMGIPMPMTYYGIGLVFGAFAIIAKFSPRHWIYFVLITPTAALLNAFTTSQAAEFGKQRVIDNAVGAGLVVIAALFTLIASRYMDKRTPTEISTDAPAASPV
jgi:hypothetical protein